VTNCAASSGFNTTWTESRLDPSPMAAKAIFFCLLTLRTQPCTVTLSASALRERRAAMLLLLLLLLLLMPGWRRWWWWWWS